MKPALLSVKELAHELGVSVQSIRRAYWRGVIPGYRIHKMLRFDIDGAGNFAIWPNMRR